MGRCNPHQIIVTITDGDDDTLFVVDHDHMDLLIESLIWEFDAELFDPDSILEGDI